MTPMTVTNHNFTEEVLECAQPVLVDFWAAWCGPCKMQAPIVDALCQERADIKVCKINVDDEPELAARFGIASIPTLLFFKNSAISKKSVGYRDKGELEKILRELL